MQVKELNGTDILPLITSGVGVFHIHHKSTTLDESVAEIDEFLRTSRAPIRDFAEHAECIEDLDREVFSVGSHILPLSGESKYFEYRGCFIHTSNTNTYIFTA